MEVYTNNSALNKDKSSKNARSNRPTIEQRSTGGASENLIDLAHVSNAVGVGALADLNNSAVDIDRTPAWLRFAGAPCEGGFPSIMTVSPQKSAAHTSPLERPEEFDQCMAIPADCPNRIAHMARGFRSFMEQASSLPPHGSGKLNIALYYSAMQGLAELLLPVHVYDILHAAGLKAGRPASKLQREVWHAIESAIRYLSGFDTCIERSRAEQPKPDWDLIKLIALSNGKVSDLVEASRLSKPSLAEILDLWFKPGEWVCLAAERETASTRPVEDWKVTGVPAQFFVPNPMSAKQGRTRAGTLSERALESVGPRRILPVEFDFSPKTGPECAQMLERVQERGFSVQDVNAALHLQLDSMVPLGAAVDSAGKSIHGHYPCAHLEEDDLQRFKEYAVLLGADPKVFVANQLVRFPGGTRADNGKVQKLLYVSPEVMLK